MAGEGVDMGVSEQLADSPPPFDEWNDDKKDWEVRQEEEDSYWGADGNISPVPQTPEYWSSHIDELVDLQRESILNRTPTP